MVSVSQNGTLHSLQKFRLPLRLGARPVAAVRVIDIGRVRETRDRAVRFNIRFQHDIEAQLVAQLQKTGEGG